MKETSTKEGSKGQLAPLPEWRDRLMAVQAQRFGFPVAAMLKCIDGSAKWLQVLSTKRFGQCVFSRSTAQFAHNKYLQLTQRFAPAS